jgi:hypothetical protein
MNCKRPSSAIEPTGGYEEPFSGIKIELENGKSKRQ